jgi:hypothetical protein
MAGKGLLLISLAIGYYVLITADKEKKQTKLLGQVIGWVIIVASSLGIWCYAQQCVQAIQGGAACPFSSKMMAPSSGK